MLISDDEFLQSKDKYSHNPPQIKEAYYYRKIFEETFNQRSSILPYYWLPKWSGNVIDPSARVLNVYSKENNEEQVLRSAS